MIIIRRVPKVKPPGTTIFLSKAAHFKSTYFAGGSSHSRCCYSARRNDDEERVAPKQEETQQKKHNSEKKTNDKHSDMWSFLAFEKNITFFSVNFYILLAAVLALHFYNKANETNRTSQVDQAKERERKNLLEMENKRKKLQN
ncbi:hypothetical protein PCYB_041130 [Plasmodium cynomolgi strain B]|uniref:Uncharacterized protein n=1 Tax=Plasmodium cynomolgi (strain B) TaxID=1120755 RepID=K6UCI5_PLACD|nr:hypothetical protein PCYB_041130 [Plasmodium cynomolgi strain B]GAB64911.1 hypothetical protein PCYB_041130 [Plasmodium cynomolgi strain B]